MIFEYCQKAIEKAEYKSWTMKPGMPKCPVSEGSGRTQRPWRTAAKS